ncbi:sodium:proton exchanger [Candidatus Woesearchaeota archaeon]|nr:sodium:proton exchanger [Candidatus Woesearchaeota archaeon]
MLESLFIELSLIIILATLIAAIVRLLKQPLIIAYILTGIIASPYVLDIVPPPENIETFAHIGIALLLFMVGLSLNLKNIKDVGKVAIATAVGQVVFTTSAGFLIGKWLGFSTISSIYIAIAISFSSTIIIMKLISDKGDIESLYARIAVGFLIVQDIIAVFALLFVSSISKGADFANLITNLLFVGVGLTVGLFLMSIYVLPKITKLVAKSQEYLLLFSLGWCFAISSIFYYFNFSIEIGALLAGISLAASPYRYEISSKLRPLRDFFLILFFIYLGDQLIFGDIKLYILPVIILSALILFGNPLIVLILMGLSGYTKKNSFFAGLTVAQISEFSLILITLGVAVGHIDKSLLTIITMIGLITITACTYMVTYSKNIYSHLSNFLSIFEKKGAKIDEHKYHHEKGYDILLLGYNRISYDLVHSLKKLRKDFLIVDYNPETIKKLAEEGLHCRYGDVGDIELLNELNLTKAKMVISTVPDFDTNLLLISKIRERNKKAIIIVISHQIDESLKLYDEGASYVIMPHFLGGSHASAMIEENKLDINKFLQHKIAHIEYLKERDKLKNIHPAHDRKK